MHVAIVSDYAVINGGAAKVAVTSARALADRGHRVSFLSGLGHADPLLDHPNIGVHCLGLRDVWSDPNPMRAAVTGIWNEPARRRLGQILARFRPERTVVHFHQWTKALSPSVIAAVARAGLAHVLSLHDYFLLCPNGLYFDHARGRPCHRRPLSPSCLAADCDARSRSHKLVRVVRQVASNAVLRRLAPQPNLIHVSSAASRLARPFLPAGARHFVVPNPVDVAKRPPVTLAANDRFLFLGRMTPEKGALTFAQAAKQAGVRAALLGAGPDAARVRAANPDAVITPWGDSRAVEAFLSRARALVFPSLWHETSGLVVFEALAKGVPVICSSGTGAADWIEPGVNGFVLPPGDAVALAAVLARLASDDALATRLGEHAYRRYWANPQTLDRHIDDLETCYRSVLA